jgi:hypothetical protein
VIPQGAVSDKKNNQYWLRAGLDWIRHNIA